MEGGGKVRAVPPLTTASSKLGQTVKFSKCFAMQQRPMDFPMVAFWSSCYVTTCLNLCRLSLPSVGGFFKPPMLIFARYSFFRSVKLCFLENPLKPCSFLYTSVSFVFPTPFSLHPLYFFTFRGGKPPHPR